MTFRDTKLKTLTAFISFFLTVVAIPVNSSAVPNTVSTKSIKHENRNCYFVLLDDSYPRGSSYPSDPEIINMILATSDHYYENINDIPLIYLYPSSKETNLIEKFDNVKSDMAIFRFSTNGYYKFGIIFKWRCKETGKKGYQAILLASGYGARHKMVSWREISEKSKTPGKLINTDRGILATRWNPREEDYNFMCYYIDCREKSNPVAKVRKLLSGKEVELSDGTIAVPTKTPIEYFLNNKKLLECKKNFGEKQQEIKELEDRLDELRRNKDEF